MANFAFSRENIRAEYSQLMDVMIQEDDARYDDHMVVMGTAFRTEVYISDQARDAWLGPVSKHIEYVSVSAEAIDAAEFDWDQVSIGPSLYEPGFTQLASKVLAAAIDFRGEDIDTLNFSVVIARTEYLVRPGDASSAPEVDWLPLYTPSVPKDDLEMVRQTASWVLGFVVGYFAKAEQ